MSDGGALPREHFNDEFNGHGLAELAAQSPQSGETFVVLAPSRCGESLSTQPHAALRCLRFAAFSAGLVETVVHKLVGRSDSQSNLELPGALLTDR